MMNREILFRGKRDDNGEWIEGNLLSDDISDIAAIVTYINLAGDIHDLSECSIYRVIPSAIGRYTGLTDKNGRKIFEGDIIETQEDYDDIFGYPATNVFNSLVIWDKKNFCYALKTGDYIQSFNDWDWDNSHVIGNIHDNPELLGGNENG